MSVADHRAQADATLEQACIVDTETSLIGIIHGAEKGRGRPAIVLINAGLLHRVGPNRLNTNLARELGEEGFCSIRIDISGLGDSLPRTRARNNLELVSTDLDRAMDYLAGEFGYQEFVLMGLCSGAYDTLRKAENDSRVVGLVNLDGTGYRTPRFHIHHVFLHLLPRALEPSHWQRLWDRYRAFRHAGTEQDTETSETRLSTVQRTGLMSMLAFTDLSREESGQLIARLARRGVLMHFVFTGGVSGYYNYHGQFDDIFQEFDFLGQVSHRFFPESDHLNMLETHRESMHQDIVNWVVRSFDGGRDTQADSNSGARSV